MFWVIALAVGVWCLCVLFAMTLALAASRAHDAIELSGRHDKLPPDRADR